MNANSTSELYSQNIGTVVLVFNGNKHARHVCEKYRLMFSCCAIATQLYPQLTIKLTIHVFFVVVLLFDLAVCTSCFRWGRGGGKRRGIVWLLVCTVFCTSRPKRLLCDICPMKRIVQRIFFSIYSTIRTNNSGIKCVTNRNIMLVWLYCSHQIGYQQQIYI